MTLNDRIHALDGRDWITLSDLRQDGQQLIELIPPGAAPPRPHELVSVHAIPVEHPVELWPIAQAQCEQAQRTHIDGGFEVRFDRVAPDEVGFTITIQSDMYAGDVLMVFRLLRVNAQRLVFVWYEFHGVAEDSRGGVWARRLASIPAADLTGRIAAAPASEAPRLFAPLQNRLEEIAAEHPRVAQYARDIIMVLRELKPGQASMGGLIIGILPSLIGIDEEVRLVVPDVADNVVAVAEFALTFALTTGDARMRDFASSALARILVDDPRFEPATARRGVRLAQHVIGNANAEPQRIEEAVLSLLVAELHAAVLVERDDYVTACDVVLAPLMDQPVVLMRILARLLHRRTAEYGSERKGALDTLNRVDLMAHVQDSMRFGGRDSFVDRHVYSAGSEQRGTADDPLSETPREFSVRQLFDPARKPEPNEWWTEDAVPLIVLRSSAERDGIAAQVALYGFDPAEHAAFESAAERPPADVPTLIFLRSLRSTRRLWVANSFDRHAHDIVTYYAEPPKLTLEAALHRCLAVRFQTIALGGMLDAFGMTRFQATGNRPRTSDPDDFDFWKDVLEMYLLKPRAVALLLPDATEGVRWEIGEIVRRNLIARTAFVMVPQSVDAAGERLWNEAATLLPDTVPPLPAYRAGGAFVYVERGARSFAALPFTAMFDGRLASALARIAAAV